MGGFGKKLAEVPAVQRARQILHKLNSVAVRVFHFEAQVPVQLRTKSALWNLDAAAGEIVPKLLGVRGFEGDVREPVLLRVLELGKDFDVLVVIDLEIGQHQPAARLVDGKGLLKAEDLAVEGARRSQVISLEADVGNAHDGRPGQCVSDILRPECGSHRPRAICDPGKHRK